MSANEGPSPLGPQEVAVVDQFRVHLDRLGPEVVGAFDNCGDSIYDFWAEF